MYTQCYFRATVTQFEKDNTQALQLMSSARLDFPCVLISLSLSLSLNCKSDQPLLKEPPNILLQQALGQLQTLLHTQTLQDILPVYVCKIILG